MPESIQSSIDLHTHTYYSDGRASPAELVRHAVARGIRTLAITDHDNARGVREVRDFAAQEGVDLIPAVELTSRWDASGAPPWESDIDVLGYFIDVDAPRFLDIEREALADLASRTQRRCELLVREGFVVSMEDVARLNPRYAGPVPLADALVERGYAQDLRGALQLMDPHREAVPVCALTIDRAIAAIRAAGGVAVLAHPSLVRWRGGWLDGRAFGWLVEMGLDGIEIYHHRMNDAARAHFLAFARQFGLVTSGGSDEHGWVSGFPRLGSQPVTRGMLNALQARADHRGTPA